MTNNARRTKLTASEKGRQGAKAQQAALREKKAAEEAREKALGGRIKSRIPPKSAHASEVPPFCYLAGGRTPEEAAGEAIRCFSMAPIEALGLVWKLRRVAAAERSSAQSAAESHAVTAAGARSSNASPKSTHKRAAE